MILTFTLSNYRNLYFLVSTFLLVMFSFCQSMGRGRHTAGLQVVSIPDSHTLDLNGTCLVLLKYCLKLFTYFPSRIANLEMKENKKDDETIISLPGFSLTNFTRAGILMLLTRLYQDT